MPEMVCCKLDRSLPGSGALGRAEEREGGTGEVEASSARPLLPLQSGLAEPPPFRSGGSGLGEAVTSLGVIL